MAKKVGIPILKKAEAPKKSEISAKDVYLHPYDRTEDQQMVVTPAMAKQILDCTYWNMRDVRSQKLHDYQTLMEQGYWVSGMTIAIAVLNGKEYFVDGQHRLLALIEYGKPMSFKITRYFCSTREQVDTVYQITDQGAVKTKHDTMMSAGTAKNLEIAQHKLRRATSAVSLIYRKFGRSSNRLEGEAWQFANNPLIEAHILSETWGDAIRGYYEAIQGAMKEMTRRNGNLNRTICAAVGLITFRADSVKAFKFWKGVGRFYSLDEDDPRFVAGRYIMGTDMKREGAIPRYSHARAILACWNAFAQNRKLSRIMVVKKNTTKVFGFDYEI